MKWVGRQMGSSGGFWRLQEDKERVKSGTNWVPPQQREKKRGRKKREKQKVVAGRVSRGGGCLCHSQTLNTTVVHNIFHHGDNFVYPDKHHNYSFFNILKPLSNSECQSKLDTSSGFDPLSIICICIIMIVSIPPQSLSPSSPNQIGYFTN